MTSPVHTIAQDVSVRRAAARISEVLVHCLVVLPEDAHRGVGIVTIKDIVQILGDEDESALDELLVSDVMTSPCITVPHFLSVVDCINLMRMAGVRSVPVLRGQEVVGVLSFTDIIREITSPVRK